MPQLCPEAGLPPGNQPQRRSGWLPDTLIPKFGTDCQTGDDAVLGEMPRVSVGQAPRKGENIAKVRVRCVQGCEAPWARPEIIADPPQAAHGTNDPIPLIHPRRRSA